MNCDIRNYNNKNDSKKKKNHYLHVCYETKGGNDRHVGRRRLRSVGGLRPTAWGDCAVVLYEWCSAVF